MTFNSFDLGSICENSLDNFEKDILLGSVGKKYDMDSPH